MPGLALDAAGGSPGAARPSVRHGIEGSVLVYLVILLAGAAVGLLLRPLVAHRRELRNRGADVESLRARAERTTPRHTLGAPTAQLTRPARSTG